MAAGLSDLDELVLRCRNSKARSYLEEAVACLRVGAFRASIVATWVSVIFDFIGKMEELSLASDANAQKKLEEFHEIARSGDVARSLHFERSILRWARDEFEFIGPIAYEDLVRLQEDRNRCAHPSMVDSDTDYQPAPEAARLHIVNVVKHLLEHGAVQGKAALTRLTEELKQPYFPLTVDDLIVHLKSGALGRPRTSLIRNYVIILLKWLLIDIPVSPSDVIERFTYDHDQKQLRDRIILTLQATSRLHREVGHHTLEERLHDLVSEAQENGIKNLVILLSKMPEIWSYIGQAQRNRIKRYVLEMPVSDIGDALPAAWFLADLRESADQRFEQCTGIDWTTLGSAEAVPSNWVDSAVVQMSKADSWSIANNIGKYFLIRHARHINIEHLRQLFSAASSSRTLRTSWGFIDLLASLAQAEYFDTRLLKNLAIEAGIAEELNSSSWWPSDLAYSQ